MVFRRQNAGLLIQQTVLLGEDTSVSSSVICHGLVYMQFVFKSSEIKIADKFEEYNQQTWFLKIYNSFTYSYEIYIPQRMTFLKYAILYSGIGKSITNTIIM